MRGILNGNATYLPKPELSQEAKEFCVSGNVEVGVLIGKKGEVIEATAISGDELLRDSAVKAGRKAVFNQNLAASGADTKGIIVYNFDSTSKCLTVGIVNKRALRLPKPQTATLNLEIKKEEIVAVQIMVDMNGKVTNAKAINGDPMLRLICEIAARQATFSPTLINGPPITVKALLVYKFRPGGKIDTDVESNDKDSVGTPITLVEPPPPFCNCRFGEKPGVLVEAKVDEKGIVTEAKGLSGHPILRILSEKAALQSKFLPTNLKSKILIFYHFKSLGEGGADAVIDRIEIKQVVIN